MNTAELLDAYVVERPRFIRLAKSVERSLRSGLRAAGLTQVAVTSRAKEVQSFVRKALVKRYVDPLSDITDKAGVRAIVPYRQYEPQFEALVHSRFRVLDRVDKRAELSDDQVGYMGLHLVVAQKTGANASLPCEIQIRTHAEDAWANMSHAMLYKAPEILTSIERRRIFRLSALAELFDKEGDGAWSAFREAPGYVAAVAAEGLEREFFRLTGQLQVDALTTEVLKTVLLPGYSVEQLSDIPGLMEQYLSDNRTKIQDVLDRYRGDDRHFFLHRPEALMIFEQLDRDPFSLETRWGARYPAADLRAMGDVWGVPVAAESA